MQIKADKTACGMRYIFYRLFIIKVRLWATYALLMCYVRVIYAYLQLLLIF